jgi:hypothetical protein
MVLLVFALSCADPSATGEHRARGDAATSSGGRTSSPAESREPVVTYAPDARKRRGPEDPVLPAGVRPCSAYPVDGRGVLSVGKDVKPPQRLKHVNADLSELTDEERTIQGMLFAEVIVNEEGRVAQVNIVRSISPGFDRAFLGEMASSVFRPAELRGKAVPVCVVFTARPHFR